MGKKAARGIKRTIWPAPSLRHEEGGEDPGLPPSNAQVQLQQHGPSLSPAAVSGQCAEGLKPLPGHPLLPQSCFSGSPQSKDFPGI